MKRIYLGGEKGKGKYVLVDDDIYYRIMDMDRSITIRTHNYPGIVIDGRTTAFHKYIVGPENIPKGMDVDHINGDIYNAMRSNLRICNKRQNMHNRGKIKSRSGVESSSKFIGVSKDDNMFRSSINFTGDDGVRHHRSKSFKNEIDAAIHYNREVIRERGEYAKINTIPVPGTIGVKEFEQLLEKGLKEKINNGQVF